LTKGCRSEISNLPSSLVWQEIRFNWATRRNKSLVDPVYQSIDQIIANREGTSTMNGSHANGFAQVAESTASAIMGALSGLYVGALMARIDIEEINSVGVLFLVILYGSVGFYLGTNLPSLPSGVSRRVLSDSGSRPRPNLIALASATGTLIAAVAALVSVYMIALDENPPVIWNVAIGFWWMLGVLLQLAAGTAARLGQFTGAAGQARSDAKRV
jgi:hypothetical protein